MVVPESTEDVSKVMKLLSHHECPFGMRSGGHAAFTGSNSIKDGVTIDLGKLSQNGIDPQPRTHVLTESNTSLI